MIVPQSHNYIVLFDRSLHIQTKLKRKLQFQIVICQYLPLSLHSLWRTFYSNYGDHGVFSITKDWLLNRYLLLLTEIKFQFQFHYCLPLPCQIHLWFFLSWHPSQTGHSFSFFTPSYSWISSILSSFCIINFLMSGECQTGYN